MEATNRSLFVQINSYYMSHFPSSTDSCKMVLEYLCSNLWLCVGEGRLLKFMKYSPYVLDETR